MKADIMLDILITNDMFISKKGIKHHYKSNQWSPSLALVIIEVQL